MKRLILFFLLAGCASRTPVAVPVPVKVPVTVACDAELVSEPDWNLNHIDPHADSVAKLKAILADSELSRGYIEELKSELIACS